MPRKETDMCVGCFVVSAFTLFVPVTEVGSPLPPEAFSSPAQVQDPIMAQHLRQAVQDMQAAASRHPNTQVIVVALGELANRLDPISHLDTAERMVDEALEQLKEDILAAPNADQLIEAMYQLREKRYQQRQGFQPFQSQSIKSWGWLG